MSTLSSSRLDRDVPALRNPAPALTRWAPWLPITCAWRHRALLGPLARRDVEARYRGSLLGIAWSLVQPLLLLTVYTTVFAGVLQTRWPARGGDDSGDPLHFALLLFAGLILFQVFSDCVSRAPELLREHASFVVKVVFPIEVLPWSVLLSSLFHAALSLAILLPFQVLVAGPPPATAWLAPLIVLPLWLELLGITWVLSALGLHVRDTRQVVGLLVTAALFLSPVFYPLSRVPEALREWLRLNPLTPAIEDLRAVLFWGELPDASSWFAHLLIGWAVMWLGFLVFQRARRSFADVL